MARCEPNPPDKEWKTSKDTVAPCRLGVCARFDQLYLIKLYSRDQKQIRWSKIHCNIFSVSVPACVHVTFFIWRLPGRSQGPETAKGHPGLAKVSLLWKALSCANSSSFIFMLFIYFYSRKRFSFHTCFLFKINASLTETRTISTHSSVTSCGLAILAYWSTKWTGVIHDADLCTREKNCLGGYFWSCLPLPSFCLDLGL